MALTSMQYKSFIWRYNPAKCTYSCGRSYVAHKYPELAGVELEDMDTDEVIITGEGEFFGDDAYINWEKLNAEFKTFGPGKFYHPIFTDVTYALMTKLQAKMEPRENYVAYTFEIIGSTAVRDINTPVIVPSDPDTDTNSATIKIGDIVILTGYAYYDSYGSTPRSEYKNGVSYTVTYTNYKGTHPIHCGSLGWCRLEDIKLYTESSTNTESSSSSSPSGSSGDIIHIVKAGETLSGICLKYGANWKSVATYNNIKNPNLIYIGQQIKIPNKHIMITLNPTKNTTQSSSSKPKTGGSTYVVHTLN